MQAAAQQYQRRIFERRRAFTLIEVLVAITIFGVIVGIMSSVMTTATHAWKLGQATSELYQTSRVAQEVLQRDFRNMMYLSETEYNQNFLRGIDKVAQEMDAGSGENANIGKITVFDADNDKRGPSGNSGIGIARTQSEDVDDEDLSEKLGDLAPPIDLSFKGNDGGKLDTIAFTRRYMPRWYGGENSWGLRRVTYSVKDGVLMRNETDPFGYNPSFRTIDRMLAGSTYAGDLALMFTPEGRARELGVGTRLDAEGIELTPPATIRNEEPICGDVEIFNVTYGFFRQGEWLEADNWDSLGREHRDPPVDEETFPDIFAMKDSGLMTPQDESEYNPIFQLNNQQENNYVSDNLPGYVTIQIGLRPGGEGQMRSFTLFFSMDGASEFDRLGQLDREFNDNFGRHSGKYKRESSR